MGGAVELNSPPIGEAIAFRVAHDVGGALLIIGAQRDAMAKANVKFGEIAVQILLAAVLTGASRPRPDLGLRQGA